MNEEFAEFKRMFDVQIKQEAAALVDDEPSIQKVGLAALCSEDIEIVDAIFRDCRAVAPAYVIARLLNDYSIDHAMSILSGASRLVNIYHKVRAKNIP